MKTFQFGVNYKRPTRGTAKKIKQISNDHAIAFIEVNLKKNTVPGINGGRYQSWFSGFNHGELYQQRIAAELYQQLEKEVSAK